MEAAKRAEIPFTFLDEVKNYLDITWDDDATDRKIRGIVASGMLYLDQKSGVQNDYTQDGTPRTLLLEYVRYMRDGALDVFETNYASMILSMQNREAVKRYAAYDAVQTDP